MQAIRFRKIEHSRRRRNVVLYHAIRFAQRCEWRASDTTFRRQQDRRLARTGLRPYGTTFRRRQKCPIGVQAYAHDTVFLLHVSVDVEPYCISMQLCANQIVCIRLYASTSTGLLRAKNQTASIRRQTDAQFPETR